MEPIMIMQLPGTRLIANLIAPEEQRSSPCDWLLFGPSHPDVVLHTTTDAEIHWLAAE
jgi:hypothetical protein